MCVCIYIHILVCMYIIYSIYISQKPWLKKQLCIASIDIICGFLLFDAMKLTCLMQGPWHTRKECNPQCILVSTSLRERDWKIITTGMWKLKCKTFNVLEFDVQVKSIKVNYSVWTLYRLNQISKQAEIDAVDYKSLLRLVTLQMSDVSGRIFHFWNIAFRSFMF